MKAYIIMADGFEEMEFTYPVSILRDAGMDIVALSISDSINVKGSHGIVFSADALWGDVDIYDAELIILPGGQPGTTNIYNFVPLHEVLRYYAKEKNLAAICAAPSVLGNLGILNERKAVCYPGYEEKLNGATVVSEGVVVDGNIITAIGAGVAKDFATEIVKKYLPEESYNTVINKYK